MGTNISISIMGRGRHNTGTDPVNSLAYGIEWDSSTSSSSLCTRIGNLYLHKILPILSLMKGCVALKGNIQYYLDPNDWSRKEDGTASRLDGYDGTVEIEIPQFYLWSKIVGTKYLVWISLYKCVPYALKIPHMLIDAYRAAVLNTVPLNMGFLSILPVNSAISVVNTNTYCRGGGNRSTFDSYLETDIFRSDLGKPRTSINRATFRKYARNAGSEILCYEYYKALYWLYVIEYANFNSLATYNGNTTTDGYKQGGIGNGVTTINWTYWSYYNGNCPLTPCGYCNEFGNGTGLKTMTVITPTTSGGEPTQTYNFQVPRWRGFDNPFGDIWTNLEGIIIQGDSEGNPKTVYTTTNPDNFGDSEATKDGMKIAGHQIHQGGWIKEFDLGETAEIIPKTMGGGSTTYKCDYNWAGNKDTSLRALLVGGTANAGSFAGLGDFDSGNGVGLSLSTVGFRNCYIL